MVSLSDEQYRQLKQYEDIHPEFNFSGFIRGKVAELLRENVIVKVEPTCKSP